MSWPNIKYVNGVPFVPVTLPANKADGIYIENIELDYVISYIKKNGIKKAFLQRITDFDFLANCHDLQHILIRLELPFSEYNKLTRKGKNFIKEYSFDVLYDFPCLKGLEFIDCENPIVKSQIQVDLSKIHGLEFYGGSYHFVKNADKAVSLQSINFSGFNECDFQYFCDLKELDTIQLTSSKIESLSGCEALPKLQCLYLHYDRSLKDISALEGVKDTLKALRIEACGKIGDFSVLGKLENLELLQLSGSNELPNLDFLKTMKKLQTFIFTMNVLDGNLSLCKNLSYVYSGKIRKHYNLKDKDMPRMHGALCGNENIAEWRRR